MPVCPVIGHDAHFRTLFFAGQRLCKQAQMLFGHPVRSSRRKLMGGENRWMGLVYVVPYVIGLLVFTAIPFGASFYLSFTDYPLLRSPDWVGLENYMRLIFSDRTFH